MAYGFDSRTGQYFDANRRFVSRAKVEADAVSLSNQAAVRLKGLVRLAAAGGINASEFETRFQRELKNTGLQAAAAGAGGKDNLSNSDYGKVGNVLSQSYRRLNGFTQSLANGDLTLAQALARAEQYANQSIEPFYHSRKGSDARSGKTQARRWLGANFNHCADCISLSTNGAWLPIEEVTPNAVNCRCGSRCKCGYQVRVFVP
jgi:hypothetical protein